MRQRSSGIAVLAVVLAVTGHPWCGSFDGGKAYAQGKSEGKGNSGGGNSGGQGNSGGGNSGGGGKSGGGSNASGSSGGPATGQGRQGNQHVNPATGDRTEVRGNDIYVVHRNGMGERVVGNRYEMRDARGRVIINRRAKENDRARLRSMTR